mmetsp:Transcript_1707/g.2367  ORF Transcript_1707/g.2367 Transcript_1707/m.2367 type:complete len:209 (+) Transcript_1707:277-903(+)
MGDIKCMGPQLIGFMVTMYFAGYALNGVFSIMPDQIGRKKTTLYLMIINCLAQTVLLLVPNFWARSAMFFILGLTQIKIGVSYVWLSECVGNAYKSTAFTIINVFEGLTLAVVGLYYLFISRDWYYLCLFMLLISILATMLTPLCPESPRWHLTCGNRAEAINELNRMASLNIRLQRISESAIFVEDPTNYDLQQVALTELVKNDSSA